MGVHYYGLVSVVGATDINAVVEDLELHLGETAKYWNLEAVKPWTFEDKTVVRFTYAVKNGGGTDMLKAFSVRHPLLWFDEIWEQGLCEKCHGEVVIHNGQIHADHGGGSRSEVAMGEFLEPDPEYFIYLCGLTLPQLFKCRLHQIARQIQYAADIVQSLEPEFYGIPRDMALTAGVQQSLGGLATQAAAVSSALRLDNVLFPHWSEDSVIQAKFDAFKPAPTTESELTTEPDETEIPF